MGDKVEMSSCGLMSLNCNKAGMVGLDKEKINQVIEAASKGSKFYAKKQADQARIDMQVESMRQALASLADTQLERARKEADRVVAQLRADRDLSRTIVHVDMDMFYAAVEMRDNPRLANIPMAVGGMGMLSTSNYLARKFGVRAAMPGFIAKKLCPELVIVPTNMDKYAEVAEVVRGVFKEYDPNFAPMSLDEAYLDITHMLSSQDSQVTPWALVQEMRAKICEHTGLTASAGIAPNCLLAKVCSDLNKPNGQYQLQPNSQDILQFVSTLSIRKVGGVGNVSEQLLKAVGVQTCQDLYTKRGEIRLLFSEGSSDFYLATSQGIGSTRIEPPEERERKSISTETTFRDTSDREELMETLTELCKDLAKDCKAKSITGQAVTVKIKTHDFKLKTKVSQMCEFSNCEELIFATAKKILTYLLDSSEEQPPALRLMGVRLSELKDENDPSLKQKQGNLLAFVRGECLSTQTVAKKFECPMCEFEAVNLGILNSHVDQCLAGGHSSDLTTAGPSSSMAIANVEDICPICEYKATSLRDLNDHIDQCISNTPVKVVAKVTEPCEKPLASIQCDLKGIEQSSDDDMFGDSDQDMIEECESKGSTDPKYESLKVETESSCLKGLVKKSSGSGSFFKDKYSEIKLSQRNEEKSLLKPPSPVQDSPLSCPVCFSSDKFQSEEDLSTHVEECLSKQEIASILKSEKTATKHSIVSKKATASSSKRKSGEIVSRSDKRCKSSSNSKIDSFFKPSC